MSTHPAPSEHQELRNAPRRGYTLLTADLPTIAQRLVNEKQYGSVAFALESLQQLRTAALFDLRMALALLPLEIRLIGDMFFVVNEDGVTISDGYPTRIRAEVAAPGAYAEWATFLAEQGLAPQGLLDVTLWEVAA